MTTDQELRARHDLILGSLGEGVYGIDTDGRATFINDAAVRILGWSGQEVIGSFLHAIHHHSHPDGRPYPLEECPIFSAMKDGKTHEVEHEVFWHANGKAIPVEYVSTPIINDGEIVGAVVVFKDVSERRLLEQQKALAFEEIKVLKDQLEQERDYLRDEIREVRQFHGIVGESDALKRTLHQIEAVVPTAVNVLILGESGVGKEGIARAIHEQSPRCDCPLVKVNCASIPAELFESEFFGHVKGAFTGAHQDRVGRLELADGGTLFLDEIGEIPLNLQGKLLRALQEQEFERVGEGTTRRADVRVVAATNRDLMQEVRDGRFREDLYYRLSVFPIQVPPLRERIEDIGPLAQHFIRLVCDELGRQHPRMSQAQLRSLERHTWPGNIRELRNVIERAIILSTGSRLNLEAALSGERLHADSNNISHEDEQEAFLTESEFRQLERENLKAALAATGWRISGQDGTAELMGLKPSTVSYRMKQFGLTRGS